MIYDKLHLILFLAIISEVSSEIEIIPNEEELPTTTGANFVLKCSGDEVVRWHFPPSIPDKTKTSRKTEKLYRTSDGKFWADLQIENAHYMDTGFYYCSAHNGTEETQIYLYVRDVLQLLAIENPNDGPKLLVQQQYDDLVIPCKPTSPDVNVTLERDSEVEAQFDPQKGFLIRQPMLTDSGEYICEARRNNHIVQASFTVNILPRSETVPKPEILVEGYEGAHIIVGQNVAITCRVTVTAGVQVALDWDIPSHMDKERIHVSDLFTEQVSVRGIERRRSYRKLTISNITIQDEGIYTCRVTDHSRNTNQDHYELEVYPVDMKYLNLTMEGKTDVLVRATEREAQWIVHIEAYPPPTIQWYGPNNNSLFHNEKYSITQDSKKTKITIHNISIKDSGIYTLHASNVVKNESLKVILLVEDKPEVNFIPDSKMYYDINKEEVIDCIITAYPMPNVIWNFVECTDHETFCAEGNTIPAFPMEPRPLESLGHVTWLSRMKWYARESGVITCRAENHLGISEDHLNFKVTDVNNGFDIWGPKRRVLSSDNILIGCGASIYEYYPEFDWIYKSIENSQWEILTNSSLKGITITSNKTSFSFQSFLDISRVTAENSGTYKCRVKSFNGGDFQEKEFKLLVQKRRAPIFTNYTNMNQTSLTLRVGMPVIWNCSVVGLPEPDVIWYKNNKILDGTNKRMKFENKNHTLHIAYTEFEDAGVYRCEASNSAGTITAQNELKLKGAVMPSKIVWWVLFVLVGFIIIFLVASLVFCRKYKSEQKKRKELVSSGLYNFYDGQVDSLDPNIDIGEQAEYLPYDKKWEFPRDKLKLGKTLGFGAFGVVLKGEACFDDGEPTTVAVKMVKKSSDFSHVKSLATELKIMAHLGQHLNVVNLLGACTGNVHNRELLVIVEYCRYGSLHKYLIHHRKSFINQIDPATGTVQFIDRDEATELTYMRTNPYQTNSALVSEYSNGQSVQTDMTSLSTPVGDDGYLLNRDSEVLATYQGDYRMNNVKPISTQDLFCWAFQVAKGMEYLASRKVLHGDLAARNILLSEGNVVKICDFGLAKSMYSRENYKNKKRDVPLPVKWMSIEAIRDGVFSTQSDIWSFGVVLWEMFSLACTPYPGLYGEQFYQKILQGYRMEKPEYATEDVYNLMLECWKEPPMLRPSFTECAERLGGMLGESVRQYYLDLNSPYSKFNEQISEENDHLGKLAEPTYENSIKTGMPDSMPEGYVCMKTSKQDAINEMELRPMITPGCNSFLNPGYQDMKNFMEHKYTNLCQDRFFSNKYFTMEVEEECHSLCIPLEIKPTTLLHVIYIRRLMVFLQPLPKLLLKKAKKVYSQRMCNFQVCEKII